MQVKLLNTKRQAIASAKSTVLTTVIIASIVVSFSIVTLNFMRNLYSYNDRVINEKEAARDTLLANIESIAVLKEKFATFESGDVASKEVLDALPSRYDFAALVTSVDSLAKRGGVQLKSFVGDDENATALKSATVPTPLPIGFRVTVEGQYEDVQKFIDVLERSIRSMQINSIELSGSDQLMKADMSVTTYYQPEFNLQLEKKVVQ